MVVRENSPGLVPVKAVPVMDKAEVPVLVNVVVKALVRPSLTVPKFKLAGAIFTVPLVTVTVAPADLVVSLTEVAVTITVAGLGTPTGAVYVVGAPLNVLVGESVPHVDAHAAGGVPCVIVQSTPPFAGSFRTVGVNVWVIFSGMMAETGETESPIASTVTVTEADFVESDIAVARMVTGKLAVGGVEGAVYVTEVLVGLLRVPPPEVGEVMAQEVGLTPAFAGSKLTVAVICEVPVACTEKGFAERETAMAAKVIPVDPDFVGSLAELA